MINLILVSAGACIGVMVMSLMQVNTISEERENAYKRGYKRGLIEGEKAKVEYKNN